MARNNLLIHEDKGFTLIELLIAMSLFSILSLSIWSFMNQAVNNSDKTHAKIELIENARVALDFMIEEIRRAQKIKIDYSSPNTLLGLEIDGTDGINYSSGAGDVVFSIDGNKILYNDIELVNNIESVSFDPPSLDNDTDGELNPELDSNEDGLMDENLKIIIKTIPLGDIDSYEITGEVSIRYKGIAEN